MEGVVPFVDMTVPLPFLLTPPLDGPAHIVDSTPTGATSRRCRMFRRRCPAGLKGG
jgi:hypothetical protein